jgi:hypothetical protein
MKSKDIFSLMVRFFGLVFLYQSLASVPNAWANFCPVFPHFMWRNLIPCLIIVGWPLGIGLWMVRGARLLVRLAYGREEPEAL